MMALTISQPFASLIASGEKWIENRTWFTTYRGPLAIHAGKGTQYLTAKELKQYPHAAIIAVGYLVECFELARLDARDDDEPICTPRWSDVCSKTVGDVKAHKHAEGPWCWVLGGVVKVDAIPARGAQGLWFPSDAEGRLRELLRKAKEATT